MLAKSLWHRLADERNDEKFFASVDLIIFQRGLRLWRLKRTQMRRFLPIQK